MTDFQTEREGPTTQITSLGTGLLKEVFCHLTLQDVCSAQLVCKSWCDAARDEHLWEKLCAQLWSEKVFIRFPDAAGGHKQKLAASIKDSKRTKITAEELCAFTWKFR